MANSTQVAAGRAISVPFHGADLYVVEHNGQPYTPMKPIVEGMGLAWQPQHRKLAANQARWGITDLVIPSTMVNSTMVGSDLNHHHGDAGQRRAMTAVPLRKLPGWLATIDPGRVKNEEARAKVVEYQNECDDVLWQYWNEGIALNPRALYSVGPNDVLTRDEAETKCGLRVPMARAQVEAITTRLDRLGRLFHPLSDQAADLVGILRALRGRCPVVGMQEAGFMEILPAPRRA
ncbi:hypothetical protein C8245_21195 [Paracidovorax avenae]|nr:hypothetical protein C8245_21195 [Paracidovorax avenae]